jgi:hypothetical protein
MEIMEPNTAPVKAENITCHILDVGNIQAALPEL